MKKLFPYLLIFSLWLLMIFITNPSGNFPLNDDWSYSISVENLYKYHTLQFSDWQSIPLIVQTIIGYIASIIFGYSHTVLRFLTLVFSLFCSGFTYFVLKKLKANTILAFIGAILLLVNPIFFTLSNTFMSDIYFTTLFLVSYYFFLSDLRLIRPQKNHNYYFGIIFSILAILIRQLALVVPIAFFIVALLIKKINLKNITISIIPFIVSLGSLKLFEYYLKISNKLPAMYFLRQNNFFDSLHSGTQQLFSILSLNFTTSLLYLGLFLFPILIYRYFAIIKLQSKKLKIYLLLFALLVGYALIDYLVSGNQTMPTLKYTGNILIPSGVGPLTLFDSSSVSGLFSWKFWEVVTILSLIGSIILVQYIIIALAISLKCLFRTGRNNNIIILFPLIILIIYSSILGLVGMNFDRYVVPMIPILLILIISINNSYPKFNKLNVVIPSIFIIFYGVYTIFSVHDYLSWNYARWSALDYLTNMDVSIGKIDGGFEFNGVNNYNYKSAPDNHKEGKSWWWVSDDKYIISFGNIQNYQVLKEYYYDQWLPINKQSSIKILKRLD